MLSIGSICGTCGASSVTQAQSQAVDRFFRRVDTNRDGKITKDELAQALQNDTVELTGRAKGETAGQVFQQLDTSNKGYITKQDAAQEVSQLPVVAGGSQVHASRPAGKGDHDGDRGGGGGAAVTVTATDPADTNQDGKVSMQEQIAYLLKQYQNSTSTAAQTQQATLAIA